MQNKESQLSLKVGLYLQTQYKDVEFRFDTGADMKLTIGQARRAKALHGRKNKGYPDLFIAEPKNGYHGLYIELKAVNIFKKNGDLKKSEHLDIQSKRLESLKAKGYYAEFSVGFNETKNMIDNYLKGRIN